MWKYVMRVGGGHYCPPHYKSNAIQNLIRIIKKVSGLFGNPFGYFLLSGYLHQNPDIQTYINYDFKDR